MRKQINKWFSHPLILQPWKEAKVQNLSHTDKCNWAEFSQCSLLVTTDVDLNWKVNLVFSVDISLKLLCHEDLELFQKLFPLVRQRSSPPLNLKIFPHIYPASFPVPTFSLNLYLVWNVVGTAKENGSGRCTKIWVNSTLRWFSQHYCKEQA